MADKQVTCITKPNPHSQTEHITHLGGYGWYSTREQVIQAIDSRVDTFFVLDPLTRASADVRVVRRGLLGLAYVQTYSDGVENNNLLSLPQCPR